MIALFIHLLIYLNNFIMGLDQSLKLSARNRSIDPHTGVPVLTHYDKDIAEWSKFHFLHNWVSINGKVIIRDIEYHLTYEDLKNLKKDCEVILDLHSKLLDASTFDEDKYSDAIREKLAELFPSSALYVYDRDGTGEFIILKMAHLVIGLEEILKEYKVLNKEEFNSEDWFFTYSADF
jgi:hypothetical protein